MSKRDYSINSSNAYNILFFDSMLLVKFIQEHKMDEDISRRMTSFYNVRNYQFAWFTNNNLTEQARGFWNMHNYQTTYAIDSTLKIKELQNKMDDFLAGGRRIYCIAG
jgi:L,D-transpeptidase YcbB